MSYYSVVESIDCSKGDDTRQMQIFQYPDQEQAPGDYQGYLEALML